MNGQQDTVFFSRKKIALFAISLLVTIAVIVFTVLEIVKVNFNWIFEQIGSSFSDERYIWFILLLVTPIYFIVYRFLLYWHWLHYYKIKVKWYDWLIFSLFSRVSAIITPFAFGTQPFQYFWLRINKVNHYQAIGLITCCSFVEILLGAIVTWPSFFYIAIARYQDIMDQGSEGTACFYLIIVGMLLDLTMTIFYFLMGYSRRLHVGTSLAANKVFKFLKMKYKTSDQIYYEYKEKAVVKKLFIQELKHIIEPILIGIFTLIFIFSEYTSMYYSLELLGNSKTGPGLSYWAVFNSINVATTANNFMPIPGGEGTTQFSLRIFLLALSPKESTVPDKIAATTQVINGAMTLWRFFAYYLLIFLGLLTLPAVIWYYVKRIRTSPRIN